MRDEPRKKVENYTNPSLVFLFINLLWIFGVIWANFGLGPVIILAWFMNHLITRLGAQADARDA